MYVVYQQNFVLFFFCVKFVIFIIVIFVYFPHSFSNLEPKLSFYRRCFCISRQSRKSLKTKTISDKRQKKLKRSDDGMKKINKNILKYSISTKIYLEKYFFTLFCFISNGKCTIAMYTSDRNTEKNKYF